MAIPVEEAIAALSTFSLEDEQPDVQGLAVLLSIERCATSSPIEYADVSAYRLSLTEDTKAINQLNTLIHEGKEMASVLYTYRSCVKALPQLPDSMKHNQTDLYVETYHVLDLEMNRLREIQRWQASAASKLAVDMQRFSRPERLINGPTTTHFWSMLKLLDVLVQLDHLKNAKASIPNDFSWYKRTFTQISIQWQETDSMREEMDDLQVTQFECGGFIIGLENNHCLADGLGTAQFINAVAELARGLPFPTIEPSWCPEAIPSPAKRSPPLLMPLPQVPTFRLHRATIDLSLESISAFKSRFFSTTSQPCSVFESLAATLWQSRTRAVATDPTMEFRLVFMANARPFVHPPLPPGFCSNCFFPVTIKTAGGWLTSATVAEVVKLIKEAKARMAEEFRRWAAGEWEEDPYLPALGYGTLFLSDWSRLGLEEVDYGWGKPKLVVPLTRTDLIPVCIVGSMPAPEKGVRLITQCVEEGHLRGFKEEMERTWDVR